jgi:DNA repair photolyase
MPLRKAAGNMYPFIDFTWCPIKGRCSHACNYCYMNTIQKRFKLEQKPVHLSMRETETNLGEGNFIFVGSSCDMFAEDVPDDWIERVMFHAKKFDNIYLFQTRNLNRVKKFLFPANTCIATTIETDDYHLADSYTSAPSVLARIEEMRELRIKRKIITIEPIMEFNPARFAGILETIKPAQVNIGADTGNNRLPEPSKEKILEFIPELEKFTTVVQKKNLRRLLK